MFLKASLLVSIPVHPVEAHHSTDVHWVHAVWLAPGWVLGTQRESRHGRSHHGQCSLWGRATLHNHGKCEEHYRGGRWTIAIILECEERKPKFGGYCVWDDHYKSMENVLDKGNGKWKGSGVRKNWMNWRNWDKTRVAGHRLTFQGQQHLIMVREALQKR